MGRRILAGLAAACGAACAPSGEVIMVLDSTMSAESLEVVAFPARTFAPDTTRDQAVTADVARFRALDDTVAALTARFREMRDSLNREVTALDTLDRRTRSYGIRYAEVRRRTLAAEQVRARRDNARARLAAFDTLRLSLRPPSATIIP